MEKENALIWITGYSGVGKTTIGKILAPAINGILLDGDEMRFYLKNTGFEKSDIIRNTIEIGAVAKFLVSVGNKDVIVCSISPFSEPRKHIKDRVKKYFEIKLIASTQTLIERDTKGLYEKRRNGVIQNLAGIDYDYEDSDYEVVSINTASMSVNESVLYILNKINL